MHEHGFQVNEGGLFDSLAHTQGNMPHLMQFLWDNYVRDLAERIEKRREAGQEAVGVEEASRRATARDFVRFCADYLAEHRCVQTFIIDANVGLVLSNHASVALSPGVQIRGTMQDSRAVPVTRGESQPGLGGVEGKENITFQI